MLYHHLLGNVLHDWAPALIDKDPRLIYIGIRQAVATSAAATTTHQEDPANPKPPAAVLLTRLNLTPELAAQQLPTTSARSLL